MASTLLATRSPRCARRSICSAGAGAAPRPRSERARCNQYTKACRGGPPSPCPLPRGGGRGQGEGGGTVYKHVLTIPLNTYGNSKKLEVLWLRCAWHRFRARSESLRLSND